ncbi:DUF2972 domain-containing protein [Campylobacter sp. MIT 21-1682]|uniref:DUF2972 domain-containing protein n=1 Tax=Campylobacter sp. MIT 21-1682 TaxID=2993734 RepID=UPI00224ADB21|nr:DUF2972 domain-containing protein [Campylobacter sp. MIT 21-1682]MCX2750573.1 DUF2972 domain-containing protein [Campylobacter sp. MIT 21-1682]
MNICILMSNPPPPSYPPLLNPAFIDSDSSQYCANLAWNLNLPLPKKYKFIYVSPHGVGAAAFLRYLNECCNVFCQASWVLPNDAKERYCFQYMCLNSTHIQEQALNISELDVKDFGKYLSLFDSEVKIICGVRDPISLLKHCLGRDWSKVERKFEPNINLTYDFRKIIEFLRHRKPDIEIDFTLLKQSSFMLHNLLDKFSSIRFIDMSEFSYDTLSSLAVDFCFSPPSPTSKELFKIQEFRGYLRYMFPLKLYANKNDVKNIFSLSKPNNHFNHSIDTLESIVFTFNRKHKSEEINILDEFHRSYLNDDMGIYISKEHFQILRQDTALYRSCKNYIQAFMEKIKEVVDESERTMLKEEELLDFLKQRPKLSLQVYEELFAKELAVISKHRPDIVQKWKYYRRFEKNVLQNK